MSNQKNVSRILAKMQKCEADARGYQGATMLLRCDYDGACYHVFLDEKTRRAKPPLYKNPPADVKRDSPGDFTTRQLRIDSAFGSALIAAMQQYAKDHNLFEVAQKRHLAAEAAQNEAWRLGAPRILIVGASSVGHMYFISKEFALSGDIRDAAFFKPDADPAQFGSQVDRSISPTTRGFTCIMLSVGALEAMGVKVEE